jgi:hypothetical protein
MSKNVLLSLSFCLFFTLQTLVGQGSKDLPNLRHQIQLGYPVEIGLGLEIPKAAIHFSYNGTYRFNPYFASETQLSYSGANFNRNSATFARDGGTLQSLNVLTGGRVLLFREESSFRVYGNALIGGFYYSSSEFNADNELNQNDGFGIGISLGLFALINQSWNVGISIETRNFLILKAGYTF